VDWQIGGYAEIRDTIAAASVDIDAQRMSDGVVAFGRDSRRLACLLRVRMNVHALHDLNIRLDFAQPRDSASDSNESDSVGVTWGVPSCRANVGGANVANR
jgi:hypothetical protein